MNVVVLGYLTIFILSLVVVESLGASKRPGRGKRGVKRQKSGNFAKYENSSSSTLQDGSIFLRAVMNKISNGTKIVYFNGPRVKRIFDLNNTRPHVLSTEKLKVNKWSELMVHINRTFSMTNRRFQAVHLHNELKFGDFLLLILQDYKKQWNVKLPRGAEPLQINQDHFYRSMDQYQPPIVMTNTADENWGFLSTKIGTRTTGWINMTNHLRIHHSDYHTVTSFLNSSKITLFVSNTHVDPMIGYHPKIICLPLGIRARGHVYNRALSISRRNITKSRLLLINNSGWGDRTMINNLVSIAFNHTVTNTYSQSRKSKKRKQPVDEEEDHLFEVAQSKFVLCPSGLGFDTYRLWETLLLGSIPIVESNAGMDRTYARLPVLVVQDYSQVTPKLLEEMYPCFERYIPEYRYEHLTQSYWLDLVDRAIETASIEHVMENHPKRNPYCYLGMS